MRNFSSSLVCRSGGIVRRRFLQTHGRYDYTPIADRPDFVWPGNRRLAVYLGVNLEHFAFGGGLGAQLVPHKDGDSAPDVLNYSWRDYGNRVGAWRLLDMLDQLELPATVLANSAMIDYAPALLQAHVDRGDEIAGHGRTNSERQGPMDEFSERTLIQESTQALTNFHQAPTGWLSPWISESDTTPELLVEAGYRYTLNWCMDDQPVWMRTRTQQGSASPLLAIPYPQELNDIPSIVARQEDATTFANMIMDNFDEMFLEQTKGVGGALVMGIALHPYIVGQPFRLRQLRRALCHICRHRKDIWLTTADQIYTSFAQQVPAPL